MENKERQLKDRFLEAINNGELGSVEDQGIIITLKDFKHYFADIKTGYISSFLPASTIEPGQLSLSHTKFVFRIGKGLYRLHQHALMIGKITLQTIMIY